MSASDDAGFPAGASCRLAPRRDETEPGQGQGARIYGKHGCPHTDRARAALPRALFVDVLADPAAMAELLRLTGGQRRVPVIVRGEAVEIGFRRGS